MSGSPAATTFSIIIVLVLVILAYAAYRLFCASKGQITGYWSSTGGDLLEVFGPSRGTHHGEYLVATASGLLKADPDKAYPIKMKGCRSISIAFPAGVLRGRVGFDRRRIIWDRGLTWYRQGV